MLCECPHCSECNFCITSSALKLHVSMLRNKLAPLVLTDSPPDSVLSSLFFLILWLYSGIQADSLTGSDNLERMILNERIFEKC